MQDLGKAFYLIIEQSSHSRQQPKDDICFLFFMENIVQSNQMARWYLVVSGPQGGVLSPR